MAPLLSEAVKNGDGDELAALMAKMSGVPVVDRTGVKALARALLLESGRPLPIGLFKAGEMDCSLIWPRFSASMSALRPPPAPMMEPMSKRNLVGSVGSSEANELEYWGAAVRLSSDDVSLNNELVTLVSDDSWDGRLEKSGSASCWCCFVVIMWSFMSSKLWWLWWLSNCDVVS